MADDYYQKIQNHNEKIENIQYHNYDKAIKAANEAIAANQALINDIPNRFQFAHTIISAQISLLKGIIGDVERVTNNSAVGASQCIDAYERMIRNYIQIADKLSMNTFSAGGSSSGGGGGAGSPTMIHVGAWLNKTSYELKQSAANIQGIAGSYQAVAEKATGMGHTNDLAVFQTKMFEGTKKIMMLAEQIIQFANALGEISAMYAECQQAAIARAMSI